MKERISVTIDKATREALEKILKVGKHRNQSHLVEDALKYYLENYHE